MVATYRLARMATHERREIRHGRTEKSTKTTKMENVKIQMNVEITADGPHDGLALINAIAPTHDKDGNVLPYPQLLQNLQVVLKISRSLTHEMINRMLRSVRRLCTTTTKASNGTATRRKSEDIGINTDITGVTRSVCVCQAQTSALDIDTTVMAADALIVNMQNAHVRLIRRLRSRQTLHSTRVHRKNQVRILHQWKTDKPIAVSRYGDIARCTFSTTAAWLRESIP